MKSMTGMGRASGNVDGVGVRVEVKSVNHRFCEVALRLPPRYHSLDFQIQQAVRSAVSRGKIDIHVSEEKGAAVPPAEIEAFRACHGYLSGVRDALGLKGELTLHDVLDGVSAWTSRDLDAEKAWADFAPVLNAALRDMLEMRAREGKNLRDEMVRGFSGIRVIAESIAARKDAVQAELEARLHEKIGSKVAEWGGVDPQRLHIEVAYYLERMDVTEELQRLKSHLSQVDAFFSDKAPSGRKIDFLLQEFNREFNTIASKAQNSAIAHLVVDAKAELEKLREQVQNIE